MAHTTAAKATASQKGNVIGKRRGVKAFGGSIVKPGSIIVRQLGRKVIPGKNTDIGRDYTIYSKIRGIVKFTNATRFKRGRKIVHVLPIENVIEKK
jgi:large subunit ribosomal protein L27